MMGYAEEKTVGAEIDLGCTRCSHRDKKGIAPSDGINVMSAQCGGESVTQDDVVGVASVAQLVA